MILEAFTERVIERGIEAARRDYADDRPRQEGSIAGFEACRGLQINDLALLLGNARERSRAAYHQDPENLWWHRCYEAEVEWVCNVVSCLLMEVGRRPILPPTARAMTTAIEIAHELG